MRKQSQTYVFTNLAALHDANIYENVTNIYVTFVKLLEYFSFRVNLHNSVNKINVMRFKRKYAEI